MRHLEIAARGDALVGEGPVWVSSERRLYWIDVKGQKIFCLDPLTGARHTWDCPQRIGAIAPRATGGFAAVLKSGLYLSDGEPEHWRPLADPEAHLHGNRFNDGKCDARGRLWAGTMDDDEQRVSGSLYRFDASGGWTKMRGDIHLSNGLGWSPDGGTFYFTDTLRRTILAFDFDTDDGELSRERTFVIVPDSDGYPDGLAVDTDGCVWSAHWGGSRLTRYAPDGRIVETLNMPVPKPSSCAFGGDGLRELFITSASIGLSEKERVQAPDSGSLFVLDAGVAGVLVMPFSG